jgi:zinc protease
VHRFTSHGRMVALIAFGTLALLSTAFADGPAKAKKIVTIEGITEYQYDNGLRVLLFPDNSTSTVTVNLTLLVGSRHEGYGETGMAHLLEHMVFKGTPTHRDVPRALRDHGASFNGTTWVDRTNYYETMPATDENLEFGIRLEADRMVNSFVKREDLISEMTVVRNEFEMGENMPENILSQRMMGVAYEWHNYGKSTIGNRSDIERVPIDRLQAFYRKYYQPDNAVLVVAGKFDENKALDYIGKYFGTLKRPERKLDATYTEEPPQDGERTVVLRRVGKVGVVGALYHVPAGAHPDFAAVEVLSTVLDSQPSGRLYKALVTSKMASNVSTSAQPYHDPGVLEIMAEVDPKLPNNPLMTARDTLLAEVEGLAKAPITQEEVDRARTKLLKNRELLMNSSNRIGIVLSDWAAKGDWRLFFLHRDRLAKVTVADVNRVAGKYLQSSNRTVGMYIPSDQPQRTPIPETPLVADLVKNYQGGQAVVAGEEFEPTPGNIEARLKQSELPGGMKLGLLPRKTRGEAVVASITFRYGNAESLRGYRAASQMLGPLMMRGTEQHTRQQIEDVLDKLKARVSPGGGQIPAPGELHFNIECKRETLPKVLAVVREIVREPSFPVQEFEVLKRQRYEMLKKGLTEPMMLGPQTLMRKLNPYPPDDVRYFPTIEEGMARVEELTVDKVRKLYEQVGGVAGEAVVIGDFDPQATTQLLAGIVGDWKSSVNYQRIPHPAITSVKGEAQNIETPDKESAVYVAGIMIAMSDSDPDFAPLELGSYLYGGGPLTSRLAVRARQKEGISYGIGAQMSADAIDKSTRLLIFAICNPKNMDKLDKAVAEETQKILKDGVTAAELDAAKSAYLKEMSVARSRDTQLAGLIAENLQAGRTFSHMADLENRIAQLTPEAVNNALRKHLDAKRMIIIRAGDFRPKSGE